MKTIKAYWSRTNNFGDTLTKILLEKLFSVKVEFAKAARAELFGVGSLIEYIPKGFSGTVLGTGQMHRKTKPNLEHANVIALRGPLTGEAPVYGDLGLLCNLLAPPRRLKFGLGVVPHFCDKQLVRDESKYGNLEIDITGPFDEVMERFSACERIVTSSLHGIILADALGIPRRWEDSPAVYGQGFKFADYALGMGIPCVPGKWHEADQRIIRNKTIELYGAALAVCG